MHFAAAHRTALSFIAGLAVLPGCIIVTKGDHDWSSDWDSEWDGCVECDPTDSDNDGVSDDDELACNLDPMNADTDNDGVLDCDEDLDGDGRTTAEELEDGTDCATAGGEGEGEPPPPPPPPPPPDSDDDGLTDDEEAARGTDAADWDSDDDGQCDGAEVDCGSSPLDPYFTCT
jgi:hypothetical protein